MTQAKKEVAKLFAIAKNISDQTYTIDQIRNLPKPVKRYFNFALTENQPLISYARLEHGGKFRQKDKWMDIKGEEYFTTQQPGFIWLAKVPFMSAKDLYLAGKGNLVIKLFRFIKVVDAKGEKIDQGELLRWLGEAPIYPTALLPSEKMRWKAQDDHSAKAILTDHGRTVEGTFYFDTEGKITTFKAKRYKEETLEDWTGFFSDYREVGQMKIPFNIKVQWDLETGPFEYVDFTIEKIEYNKPEKY
jgi:hypothetical protein